MRAIHRQCGTSRPQEGVVLLEALIGLLIFSLGIMALVAMQSVAVSNVSNAKYRTDAALFADELINLIWVDRGNRLANVPNYAFPGGSSPKLLEWQRKVQDPLLGLPKAQTLGMAITATPLNNNTVYQVSVTLNWQGPDALTPSRYTVVGYISDAETCADGSNTCVISP